MSQYSSEVISFLDRNNSNVIKGIAAFMIMLSHYCSGYPWYIRMIFPGQLWVAVFFFYSGYGLKRGIINRESYLNGFIYKKIISVYIPFFFAETAYTIFIKDNMSIFHEIIACFGLELSNSVLWYVIEIMPIYVFFFVIEKIIKRDWIWIPIYIVFVLCSVYFDIGNWWYISTSTFLIGIFIAKNEDTFLNYLNSFKGYLVIAIILLYICREYLNANQIGVFGFPLGYCITFLDMILAPCFVLFLMSINYNILKGSLLADVLKGSYELYLWHMLFFKLTEMIINNRMIVIMISIVISVLGSLIISNIWGILKAKLLSRNSQVSYCQ